MVALYALCPLDARLCVCQGYSVERMAILRQLARSGVGVAHLDLDQVLGRVEAAAAAAAAAAAPTTTAVPDGAATDGIDAEGNVIANVNGDDHNDDDDDEAGLDLSSFLGRRGGGRNGGERSHHPLYDSLVKSVDRQIRQLRVILESAEAKEKERE